MSVSILSNPAIKFAALLALVSPASARTGGVTVDGREQRAELLVFGANWCAPCRAELAELPDLAQAVAPDRLVLAWTDAVPSLPTSLPGNVTVVTPGEARSKLASYAAINAGLPFSVARDANGRICGSLRRRMSPGDAASLMARCRATR